MCLMDCGFLGVVDISCTDMVPLPCCSKGSAHESCICGAQNQYLKHILVTVKDAAPVWHFLFAFFILSIQVGSRTANLILCSFSMSDFTQQDQSIWSEAAVLH